MKVHGILLAAGKSLRFEENKLFSIVNDSPVIKYPVETFTNSSQLETITITINSENQKEIEKLFPAETLEKVTFIEGGNSRNESEFIALEYLEEKSIDDNDLIVIHDAARAFLSSELLERLILHALEFGSAAPYLYSGLLIDDNEVRVNQEIIEIQTPQIFDFKNLLYAYRKANIEGYESVDTTECISKYTEVIPQVVEGEILNKKITYKNDIYELQEMLNV